MRQRMLTGIGAARNRARCVASAGLRTRCQDAADTSGADPDRGDAQRLQVIEQRQTSDPRIGRLRGLQDQGLLSQAAIGLGNIQILNI